jgi:tetraacyldisaccharide 4'-kinase
VLDDGFQHFQLDRDADIVLVTGADLEGVTFPSGRLREPPDVLVAADAIVTLGEGIAAGEHRAVFSARRTSGAPVFDGPSPSAGAVFAVAAIADPEPFFSSLEAGGLRLAGRAVFRDHHPYSARDVQKIFTDAVAAGAIALMTTEKDYVRLLRHRPFPMPVGWLPLTMEPEPLADFQRWLASSIASTRDIVIA